MGDLPCSTFPVEATFFLNRRGTPNLLDSNDYIYFKHACKANKTNRWICNTARVTKCRGMAFTDGTFLLKTTAHNHIARIPRFYQERIKKKLVQNSKNCQARDDDKKSTIEHQFQMVKKQEKEHPSAPCFSFEKADYSKCVLPTFLDKDERVETSEKLGHAREDVTENSQEQEPQPGTSSQRMNEHPPVPCSFSKKGESPRRVPPMRLKFNGTTWFVVNREDFLDD